MEQERLEQLTHEQSAQIEAMRSAIDAFDRQCETHRNSVDKTVTLKMESVLLRLENVEKSLARIDETNKTLSEMQMTLLTVQNTLKIQGDALAAITEEKADTKKAWRSNLIGMVCTALLSAGTMLLTFAITGHLS